MTLFALTVTFRLKPGARPRFLPLVRENARASVRDEPGCLRFDVLLPEGGPEGGDENEVFLYEIYEDRAAFDAHRAAPHYGAFDAAARDLVEEKRVRFYAAEAGA